MTKLDNDILINGKEINPDHTERLDFEFMPQGYGR
jgi:hypothetical protein